MISAFFLSTLLVPSFGIRMAASKHSSSALSHENILESYETSSISGFANIPLTPKASFSFSAGPSWLKLVAWDRTFRANTAIVEPLSGFVKLYGSNSYFQKTQKLSGYSMSAELKFEIK